MAGTAKKSTTDGLSAAERAAVKERAAEVRKAGTGDGEQDVLDKIASMADADRPIAERLHAVVTAAAPDLTPRLWYGMPAYAKGSGRSAKVVCFFRAGEDRYVTFGFSDVAMIDDGGMWPTSWAVTKLGKADEELLTTLVATAAG